MTTKDGTQRTTIRHNSPTYFFMLSCGWKLAEVKEDRNGDLATLERQKPRKGETRP